MTEYDSTYDPGATSLDPVLTQRTTGPSPAEAKQAELDQDRAIKERLATAEAAGPTIRQRTQSEVIDLSLFANRMGNPFSVRWIPFEQLRDMTTDLMLAFGWWMTVNPLIKADWAIECADAQLAAAVDEALRPVIPADFLAFSNAMWYGHQPLVKQFKLGRLDSTYRDPNGSDPNADLPVWSSSADVLLWKPLLTLNPSHCVPTWNDDGEMTGFKFSNTPIPHFDLISAASAYGYEVIPGHVIDSDRAIWITNESELNFGSVFGSARTKRAYRYWWSYWTRWNQADRSYENLADPPKWVYYPVDFDQYIDPEDPNQENPKVQQARATALAIGEQMRSGSVTAFPGTFAEGNDGKSTGHRKWEAGYYETKNNFTDFDAGFRILDNLKIRAWFVPEQAVVEGCLRDDTPVLCPRDHDQYPAGVPLKDIKPGQLIWSFNEREERFQLWPVKSVHFTKIAQTFKVTLDDGSEIIGTDNHPFLMRDGTWRELRELTAGDSLMPLYEDESLGHRPRELALTPYNHKVVSVQPCSVEPVWDIEMDAPVECQNFVAAGVVVHNSGNRSAGGSAGGTGGSRMASQLSDVHEESEQALIEQYDAYINEHKIPQFIAANFPEKIGTPCRKVSRAMGSMDDQTLSQVFQLIGQVRGEVLPVDIRAVLKQLNVPLLNNDQFQAELKQIKELAATQGPPETAPSQTGTQGYNAGVMKTARGNQYYQGPERIVLAESDGFMNSLPDTPHFRDAAVRSALVRLRRSYLERYEQQYKSFSDFLRAQATLHLAQQNGNGTQNGLSKDQAKASAAAIIAAWAASNAPGAVGHPVVVATEPGSFAEQAAGLVEKIVLAGGSNALKRARLDAEDFGAGVIKPWVQGRVKFDIDSVDGTVRDEAQGWLADELQKSVDPTTVAQAAEDHFAGFPQTHADRVARTTTTDAFNEGSLDAMERAGVAQVQAHDASDGTDHLTDAACQHRNGRVFSIAEARAQKTHPNDTLYWMPLSTEKLSVQRVSDLPSHLAREGLNVAYDERREILYLTEQFDEQQEQTALLILGEQLTLR